MVVKQKASRFAALAAVGGMVLAGCATQEANEPEETPTEEMTPTASPTAPDVDLDQYADALVTDPELMGSADDRPVEGFVDEPFSMYLTLSDFSPSGTCEELLEELNGYSTQAVGGVAAHFVKDVTQQPADDAEPPVTTQGNVQTMIFETQNSVEPMDIYRDIPNECETLTSSEVEGAEAEFAKVPGLDAIYLEISDGEEVESLVMGGSSVNGQYHMYMTAEQVSMDESQEMLGAQAEALQEAFEDEDTDDATDDAAQSPTATESPTEG